MELCELMKKKQMKKHQIDSLYLIQLFDYNCLTCVSGVTKVYVEDIDKFAENYLSIEKDEERIDRFLRSKAGEIVTDYYSDDPSLNIVQKISVEDCGWDIIYNTNQIISVLNGYGWPSSRVFDDLAGDAG